MKFVNKNGLRAYEHELNKVLYAAGYGMRTMWDSMPKPIKFVRNFFAEIDRQLTGEYDDEEPLNAEEKKV